jgi:predicted ATPase
VIAAVHFQNFKALRSAAVQLGAFNLLLGPSGSGKTSLIQSLLQLRTLSALPAAAAKELKNQTSNRPQIRFDFDPPFDDVRVTLGCDADDVVCDFLVVTHESGKADEGKWTELRSRLQTIRAFTFDHTAMAFPAKVAEAGELTPNGSNLAAVLAARRSHVPGQLGNLEADFCRIMPEFSALEFRAVGDEHVELLARLAVDGELLPAQNLSQGTLHLLAVLTLAHAPEPPGVLCIEEVDRGVHPRLLREVRDALYRLSHPMPESGNRAAAQVLATTHSPYLLDLFREHPEEIILANKQGNAASFERLSDRADLLELMKESTLGDLWYSGILGGVPGE